MSVLFAAVSGFLGAGKTTTLLALARELEASGRRVAVITNDQGEDLVDTAVAQASGSRVGEVTGGCFCCRFEDLLAVATRCFEEGADVILAEAVGSCTDLQATVIRPLRRLYGTRFRVAPLLTVVDPARFASIGAAGSADLAYLFDRQLAEADVIALNKEDLGGGAAVRAALAALHPGTPVLGCSALNGKGLAPLMTVLTGASPAQERELEIDYDRYAAAEAELAWLNHTVEVRSALPFASGRWAAALLDALAQQPWLIGHAKVHLALDGAGETKASAVGDGRAPSIDVDGGPTRSARARLNARMACTPAELDAAVSAALRAADLAAGAHSSATTTPAAFSPSYPRPLHRLPAG